MRTYWKSEAPENSYYIKYSISSQAGLNIHEFWTDEEEKYNDKLGFVERHIGTYRVLDKKVPV
jgi:hypothetical protein